MFWVGLLIVHGLVAFLLLGAVTHQAVSTTWRPASKRQFIMSFASVRAAAYTNAVVALFMINFAFGAALYANYSAAAKTELILLKWLPTIGLFELKEHSALIGLALLPTYWLLWKKVPLDDKTALRTWATLLLAALVWWAFLVGHIVNNTRGIAEQMVAWAF